MSTKKYHLKCIDNYNNYAQNGGHPFQTYPISTLQQRIGHFQTQIPFGYSQTRPNTSLQYQIPVQIKEQPTYEQPLVPPTSGSTLLHTLDVSDASSYNMSKIPLSPKGHPTIVPLNMMNNIQSPRASPITPIVVSPVMPIAHVAPVVISSPAQGLPFFSVMDGINNASFAFTPFNNIISPFGKEPEQKIGKQDVDGKIFTGAGIMLLENIGENIVLFKSRKTGEFEELGGKLNENDVDTDIPRKNVLIKVAKREAYEESACYVDFENDNLRNANYVNIKKGDEHYRCFIKKIDSTIIIIKDIAKNFEIIRNSARTYNAMNVSTDNVYSKPSYMEMIGVARFSISALKEAIKNYDSNDNIKCKNLDGDICSIRDRTVELLKKMIVNENNYNIIKKDSSTIETLKIDNGLTTLKIK
jgi:hypothetical protein